MTTKTLVVVSTILALGATNTFAERGDAVKAPSTTRSRTAPLGKDGKPVDIDTQSRSRLNTLKDVTSGGVSTGGKVQKEKQEVVMPVVPTATKPAHADSKGSTDTKAETSGNNKFLSGGLKKEAPKAEHDKSDAAKKSEAKEPVAKEAGKRGQPTKTSTDPSVFKSVEIGVRLGDPKQDIAALKKVLTDSGADADAIEAKVDAILAKVGGKDDLEKKRQLMETMAAEAKSVADFNLKSDGKEKAEFNSKAMLAKIEALAEAINAKVIDPKQRAQILADIVLSYSDIPNHKKRGSDGTGFLELAIEKAIENVNTLDAQGLAGFINLKATQREVYEKARQTGASFAKARELARQARINMLSENGVALKWTDKDGKEHNFCECDGTCSKG